MHTLSFTWFGAAPVAQPRQSIVIKSGSQNTATSKSSSICDATILIPIGRHPVNVLRYVTRSLRSSFVLISG